MAPWIVALLVGCGSSSTESGATTTQTAASTSSGGAASTTPAVPTVEAAAANSTISSTAPTVTPATPETTPATTPATTPEATPAAATTPPVADAATLARGRRAFTRACGNCHEDNDPEGPSPNHNWEEARMRSQVRQGAGRMRAIPVSRLSDADLDAMFAFFRSTHAVR